jgi:hypothetical protein
MNRYIPNIASGIGMNAIQSSFFPLPPLHDFTALWTLAAFTVSQSYTQSVGLLDGRSARLKAATYTQNNTNTE